MVSLSLLILKIIFTKNIKIIRYAKNKYWTEKFHLSTNNSKETWKNINEVMNRKSNPVQIPEYFVTENGIIKDPYLISNQLNNYFINVGPDISKN